MKNQDGTGQYIWLRYATEYSKDGRKHTIEMGIPVPVGASVEAREDLLREAEAGLSQLVEHVEQRVSQSLGLVQSSGTTGSQEKLRPAPQPSSTTKVVYTTSSMPAPDQPTQPIPPSISQTTRPVNRPAAIPAPPTTPQAPNIQRPPSRTAPPAAQTVDIPPTRHSIGASMPSSLSPNSTGGNLSIPEFVGYVRENMHLSPKQAMDMLRVKSLSDINLREALETLKRIVTQNAQNEMSTSQPQVSTVREMYPDASSSAPSNLSSTPLPLHPSQPIAFQRQDATMGEFPTRPIDEVVEQPAQDLGPKVIEIRAQRPAQPVRVFDEEDELEDLDEPENLNLAPEISPERLSYARDKINALREMQGARTANAARLQVLRNAADDDVTDEQLQELATGVWNIPTLKKLKMDQVEALISWAKEDAFLDEVEAVLVILEEERYARGNR